MDPSKIEAYRESLAEVEDALIIAPDNAELLKVREDLYELLKLHDVNPQEPDQGKGEKEHESSEVVGRTCILSSTFQYAIISRVVARSPGTNLPIKLAVIIFGDDEEAEVDAVDLRLLGPYDSQALHPESEVQALYGDGQWYNCTVKSRVKNGMVLVSYDGYDEQEELSLDRIRSRTWNPESKKKSNVTTKKDPAAKKFITTPGGYTIPTSLLVKPGDSAQTREKKRKALEKLKRETKMAKLEKAYEERQSNWQDHVKKAQAKFRAQMVFTRRKH